MNRPADVLNFLTTDYGKPFKSAAAFGNKFAKWCKAAGLKPVLCDDGKVRSYRPHGLRKASIHAFAHGGASDQELMAIGGWTDPRQLHEYLKEIEQEFLAQAAVDKLLKKRAEAKTETPTYTPSAPNLQTGT